MIVTTMNILKQSIQGFFKPQQNLPGDGPDKGDWLSANKFAPGCVRGSYFLVFQTGVL